MQEQGNKSKETRASKRYAIRAKFPRAAPGALLFKILPDLADWPGDFKYWSLLRVAGYVPN